jgi:hypothetical protein
VVSIASYCSSVGGLDICIFHFKGPSVWILQKGFAATEARIIDNV